MNKLDTEELRSIAFRIGREIEDFLGKAGAFMSEDEQEECKNSVLMFEEFSQQQQWEQLQEAIE